MGKHVFVTGAAGFIGSRTSRVLHEAGWTVCGIGLGGSDIDLTCHGISRWFELPLTIETLQRVALETGEPEAIIHCAGSGSVPDSLRNPSGDFLSNVNTTLAVLEFSRCCRKPVRVVLPSSAAVYGASISLPIAESAPLHPISPYGVHKIMAEELCMSYARFWGVPVCIIRLFSIYGAGLRKQLLWDACCKATDGNFSFFGSGREIRDWLHVNDAARLMTAGIDYATTSCPILNGGTGVGTAVQEVLSKLGALWDSPQLPVFTGQTKEGDPANYIADTTLVRQLGFKPQVSLSEGLDEYVDWFNGVCA